MAEPDNSTPGRSADDDGEREPAEKPARCRNCQRLIFPAEAGAAAATDITLCPHCGLPLDGSNLA